jgi:hypothetical protein
MPPYGLRPVYPPRLIDADSMSVRSSAFSKSASGISGCCGERIEHALHLLCREDIDPALDLMELDAPVLASRQRHSLSFGDQAWDPR